MGERAVVDDHHRLAVGADPVDGLVVDVAEHAVGVVLLPEVLLVDELDGEPQAVVPRVVLGGVAGERDPRRRLERMDVRALAVVAVVGPQRSRHGSQPPYRGWSGERGSVDVDAAAAGVVHGGDELDRRAGVGEGDRRLGGVAVEPVAEALELAPPALGARLPAVEDLGDGGGRLVVVGLDVPRVGAVLVGGRAALGRQVGEVEPVAGDLLLGAERGGDGGQRAVGQLEGDGGAVLHLDVVHAGGDAGEDLRGRHRRCR